MTHRRRRLGIVAACTSLTLVACSMAEPDGASAPQVTFATVAPTVVPTLTPSSTTSVPPSPTAASVRFDVLLTGLDRPVDVAWRDGDDTMFVAQQGGTVVPVRDGVAGLPVLDLAEQVSHGPEQGLLGLTFSTDGNLAYTDHTDAAGDTIVTEYPVAVDGRFDAAHARVLLVVPQPYDNHNGGNVAIGPDGMLYIGMGDGGSSGDPERRALDVSSLLGKILRIDPTPDGTRAYTIPSDNPFVDVPRARGEVWAVGLRNPWRFSFDETSGDLWIGDVGQDRWEEIDVVAPTSAHGAGWASNFGWSALEGTHAFNADQPDDGATAPVYEYEHSVEIGCSVSGGAVYRGTAIAALVGWYVYADYCSGGVYALHRTTMATTGATAATEWVRLGDLEGISAVRAAPDGALHLLEYSTGTLYVMQPA